MTTRHMIIIACPTVLEHMRPFLPSGIQTRKLDFGLHASPDKLKQHLQAAIESVEDEYDIIVLGYGMCANGVVGLNSKKSTLVVPRVNDCIAIFFGSASAYRQQSEKEVGTYYLTKGWIEVCDTPLDEHRRLAEQYGLKKADQIMDVMFGKYKRLVYIRTGLDDKGGYENKAREIANKFSLDFETIEGSDRLIKKAIQGPWEDDFVIAPPGHTIKISDFFGDVIV